MMKYLIALIVLAFSAVSTVSAATGSTSTGSTAPALTCQTGLPCAGGPVRGFNVTTQSYEIVPQCFPYVWLVEFYKGNIFDLYINQNKCRAQRFIDFGM